MDSAAANLEQELSQDTKGNSPPLVFTFSAIQLTDVDVTFLMCTNGIDSMLTKLDGGERIPIDYGQDICIAGSVPELGDFGSNGPVFVQDTGNPDLWREFWLEQSIEPVPLASFHPFKEPIKATRTGGRILLEGVTPNVITGGDEPRLLRVSWSYRDWDGLERPLAVRVWRPGDRFRPLGAPGSRKLQDFMTDAKIPKEERRRLLIVTAGRTPICRRSISP